MDEPRHAYQFLNPISRTRDAERRKLGVSHGINVTVRELSMHVQ